MKDKIAIYTYMEQPEIELEQQVMAGSEAEVVALYNDEAFEAVAAEISVLILANPEIDAAAIERMPNCKGIVRRGIGFDNIDVKTASAKGLVICNVPDYCYPEVADTALAHMLTLIKRLPQYDADVRRKVWHIDSPDDRLPLARGMQHMTLGLAGFGHIAREVAKRGQAFFRQVIAYDPYVDPAIARELNVELVSLEDLFVQAQVVSVHMPSTTETYHAINKTLFSRMKEGSYLINTARGSVIDEQDLYTALKDGTLAGAGLDVTEAEPIADDSPLLSLPNLLITPHIGFYSTDSFTEMRRKACLEARRVYEGKQPLHPVN